MHSNNKSTEDRKMNLRVICVLILSSMFLLSACGGNSSSNSSNNTAKKGTVQITGVAAQ